MTDNETKIIPKPKEGEVAIIQSSKRPDSSPQKDNSINDKPDINWFENFNNQNKNYAPKQYPYWSTGAGSKQNVYRKNK